MSLYLQASLKSGHWVICKPAPFSVSWSSAPQTCVKGKDSLESNWEALLTSWGERIVSFVNTLEEEAFIFQQKNKDLSVIGAISLNVDT